jgi:diguanylate cyclase (GGDEF)-like protein
MGTHYRIGLLINDFGSEYPLGLEKGISRYCDEHGCTLYVFSIGEFDHVYSEYGYQKRASTAFINQHCLDGLIFVSIPQVSNSTPDKTEKYITSFNPLPIINIGYDFPGIPCITIDEKAGIRSIMRHLISVHRCRNILLMGAGTTSLPAAERQQVYREEMKAAGLGFSEDSIMNGMFTYNKSIDAIKEYAEKHHGLRGIDAIVALNDDMACGIIDFCRENKIRVPEDIIVTGYDDILRASYTIPTITSVTQHLYSQGMTAAETLVQIINGNRVPHLQTIPTKALYRQSCGCIRSGETVINAITDTGERITKEMQETMISGAEWYKKRLQMQCLIGYQESQQNTRTLATLRKTVINDLVYSNMICIAICLYDSPVQTDTFSRFTMPDKAYIFAAQDSVTGVQIDGSQKNIVFNPNMQIIPENILDESSGKFYIIPLYQCRIQYGYMIFKPGDYDDTMYMMLATTLSSIIDSAYSFMMEKDAEYTDDLTRLLNEKGFMQKGQKTIQAATASGEQGLVIYGDMDGLKNINDTYGHEAGDRAIAAEASLLDSIFRSSDITGRLHGDEFGIVAPGLTKRVFTRISSELRQKTDEWNRTSGEPFTLSISLGTAEFSKGKDLLAELLKEADTSMYDEKNSKHGRK